MGAVARYPDPGRAERPLERREVVAEVAEVFSPIQGSPYERHEVYLTDRGFEGRHLILSDRMELEYESGILVGLYADYETPVGHPQAVASIEEAVALALRLAA